MKTTLESVGNVMLKHMEVVYPISGSGLGFLAWVGELAPLISIIAATVGIILGVHSHKLKTKKTKLEIKQLEKLNKEGYGKNGETKKDRISTKVES